MEDRIKEIINKEFNASIIEINKITEGYSHFMYELKIDKEPHAVILRFANNTEEDFNLAKEKYVIELLAKHSIPVPKIYAFHHPENKEEGYMIMEKIKGIRLDTIWEALGKEEKLEITKKIGKLLSSIHSIKFDKFGIIKEKGEIKTDAAFYFRQQGERIQFSPFLREYLIQNLKDIARLLSYKHVSPEFISKFMYYIVKNLEIIDYSDKPTLVHGDLMPGHIFVEKKDGNYEITGIIDFEFAMSYSPEWDFIKLHRKGFFDDSELKNALAIGYGKPLKEKTIEVHRLLRDLAFAWVVLEAGNKDLSNKTLKQIEEKLDKIT